MGKQPYIPFYVGDYLKDTRILPLAVRGAWVDILLFMWDAPVRGELIGTIADFARLMGCDKSEAEFALNLLKQKGTADFILLPNDEIKIVSRKMVRDAKISATRSEVGKKGVEARFAKQFAQPKGKAKVKQNTDIDNEYDIGNRIIIIGVGTISVTVNTPYQSENIYKIFELDKYFEKTGQLEEIKRAGWNNFAGFIKKNPAAVFNDAGHLYNSFRQFSEKTKAKSKLQQ